MRHRNSINTHRRQRDSELLKAYRQQVTEAEHVYLPEVLEHVVSMPTKRFWVSEERATIIIKRMMRGDELEGMRPSNKELYREILSRGRGYLENHPMDSLSEAVWQVVNGPAPRVYMTADSARVILHRARRLCKTDDSIAS